MTIYHHCTTRVKSSEIPNPGRYPKVTHLFHIVVIALILASNPISAQQNTLHIGYVYPAGAQTGSVVKVVVGGQSLGTVHGATLSCPDITVKFLEYNRPMTPKQFSELRERLRELEQKRRLALRRPSSTNIWTPQEEKELVEIKTKIIKNPPNRQATPAIAETVILELTIPTNAQIGPHEIRLIASNGISNPLPFYIGILREFTKPPVRAPNPELDQLIERLGGKPQIPSYSAHVQIPATLNGQILPSGKDRYTFTAHKGQYIIARVQARELIPYIADAVPGWFQAVLALYDKEGHELAYIDDYEFNPDPSLMYLAPYDGQYQIEIRDALFRGREDFVYRLSIGELPFVTNAFPLGGQVNQSFSVQVYGWNLPTDSRPLQLMFHDPGYHVIHITNNGIPSNPLVLSVDTLPETFDQEPNDSVLNAQPITIPTIINGKIDHKGDVDVFKIQPPPGEDLVVEVKARRLGSPLDSIIQVLDTKGNLIAQNDDFEDKSMDLITHHADSNLHLKRISVDQIYVRIADVQNRYGPHFSYRLRISHPIPDFTLYVTPSSVFTRPGMNIPIMAFVVRKDGFTNEITLSPENSPPGFVIHSGTIPAGQNSNRFTIWIPPTAQSNLFNLTIKGSAIVDGQSIIRRAIPADHMMQAFAYTHLVPAKQLLVAVSGTPRNLPLRFIQIQNAKPIKIPNNGTATITIGPIGPQFVERFELELDHPPEGITLAGMEVRGRNLNIKVTADPALAKPGLKGNLILNLLARNSPLQATNRPPRKVFISTLPAVPFEVVNAD